MLPDEIASDREADGGRYDHMVKMFGQKFVQEKIMNARTFMVSILECAVSYLACHWRGGRGKGGRVGDNYADAHSAKQTKRSRY